MCTYHAVEKDVEPKIKALRAAEGELRVAEKEKNAALAQLATVQASLDDMQVYFLKADRIKASGTNATHTPSLHSCSAHVLLSLCKQCVHVQAKL